MPATLLTTDEIANLDEALKAAYRMHASLRAAHPMARLISRPPIPAPLSESLVATAAPTILGEPVTVASGGRRCDLLVVRDDGAELTVEVKATGVGEFQEVKPRDLASDVLVWVAFGSRYEAGQGAVDLFVLPRPDRFSPPKGAGGEARRKFMLRAFLDRSRQLPGFAQWRLSDIPGRPVPVAA